MRIAIAADGPKLENKVEPVLGRADWFVIVEHPGWKLDALENPHRDRREACGTNVAKMLLALKVDAVLAGNCGPKAALACRREGLSVSYPHEGTVQDAANRYLELLEQDQHDVEPL